MYNLFLLNESVTSGSNYVVLNFISLSSILCGILVIISKNPIVSVLFLIGLFLSISGYLMMLGINFIGLSYLLVYVGAVSILFLFILMLINVRISELVTENNNSVPLAIMISVIFSITLHEVFPSTLQSNVYNISLDKTQSLTNIDNTTSNNVTSALSNVFSFHKDDLFFVSSQI